MFEHATAAPVLSLRCSSPSPDHAVVLNSVVIIINSSKAGRQTFAHFVEIGLAVRHGKASLVRGQVEGKPCGRQRASPSAHHPVDPWSFGKATSGGSPMAG